MAPSQQRPSVATHTTYGSMGNHGWFAVQVKRKIGTLNVGRGNPSKHDPGRCEYGHSPG